MLYKDGSFILVNTLYQLKKMVPDEVIDRIKKATRRLLLLDYDGTLVDFAVHPGDAVPSDQLLDVIEKLSSTRCTRVVIVTGRKHEDIEKFVGHMPVTIIAEHGAIRKMNGEWVYQLNAGTSWKSGIMPAFEDAVRECSGSFIEEKKFSLVWHYRNSEYIAGRNCATKLIDRIGNTVKEYKLRVLDGNMAVEVITGETGKAHAVQQLTDVNCYDCVLCIGDDKTDEDMFEYLAGFDNAVTIKVGNGMTSAAYQVDDVNNVISILKQLPG